MKSLFLGYEASDRPRLDLEARRFTGLPVAYGRVGDILVNLKPSPLDDRLQIAAVGLASGHTGFRLHKAARREALYECRIPVDDEQFVASVSGGERHSGCHGWPLFVLLQ